MRDPSNDEIYARLVWLFTFAFGLIIVGIVASWSILILIAIVICTIIIAINIIEGDGFTK